MRAEFAARRRFVVDGLEKIAGISCVEPRGAFYVFPNISDFIGKTDGETPIENDLGFSLWLLDEARVALVPGSAFGAPGYVRMSYAASMADLEEGLRRIADATASLR